MSDRTIYIPDDGSAPSYVVEPPSRRERIATAMLPFCVGGLGAKHGASVAVAYADALIAELDKEPSR